MANQVKTVPAHWKKVLDADTIARSLSRVSYEIVERDRDISKLAVVGVRTCGEFIAQRIRDKIQEIEHVDVPFGIIDITLYRDDLLNAAAQPTLKGTDLPFSVSGARIVLVDDVLFTGRTVRAALDAIIDFGRPSRVELACLVDRGHRELPIRADYVGKNLPTNRNEFVRVRLSEQGFEDGVYVVSRSGGKNEEEEQ
ncbi:MAG: bifunctional pyr operon transcriptional regulator/uracil phosphoribosyltransferase PyrR [Bdellovibrionota bacterium]|nr:MAG: bifunctional pyr operon transcriptional regulator/uracil phosphoribosyltransferase PyrR [Bdellovibrionota bacterium]